ncbi:MAG: hypothetical protein ABIH00_04525 [Armatimonadota bacterium]
MGKIGKFRQTVTGTDKAVKIPKKLSPEDAKALKAIFMNVAGELGLGDGARQKILNGIDEMTIGEKDLSVTATNIKESAGKPSKPAVIKGGKSGTIEEIFVKGINRLDEAELRRLKVEFMNIANEHGLSDKSKTKILNLIDETMAKAPKIKGTATKPPTGRQMRRPELKVDADGKLIRLFRRAARCFK